MEVENMSTPSSSATEPVASKHRQLRAELNFLPRADGSCALEQGGTLVWASVNGPGDVASSKRLDDKLYVEVVYRHGQSSLCSVRENRLLTSVIEQIVDCVKYPHKMIAVTIQEMHSDGSEMAASATSACLALLDSGIAMNGVFCGICVSHSGDTFVLDPCLKVAAEADSIFTFVFKSFVTAAKGRRTILVGCCTDGTYEYGVFEAALKLAREASADVFLFLREAMQRKLSIDSWMVAQ
ncbi:unnamed protein product [Toxocara canis]|nr:unnamed protein product [Toxocara canis]